MSRKEHFTHTPPSRASVIGTTRNKGRFAVADGEGTFHITPGRRNTVKKIYDPFTDSVYEVSKLDYVPNQPTTRVAPARPRRKRGGVIRSYEHYTGSGGSHNNGRFGATALRHYGGVRKLDNRNSKLKHEHMMGTLILPGGWYGAVNGKKGKKLNAAGNEAAGSFIGSVGGMLPGAALAGAGAANYVRSGGVRGAGLLTAGSTLAGLGSIGGGIYGNMRGAKRNQDRGYYSKRDAFNSGPVTPLFSHAGTFGAQAGTFGKGFRVTSDKGLKALGRAVGTPRARPRNPLPGVGQKWGGKAQSNVGLPFHPPKPKAAAGGSLNTVNRYGYH